MPWPEKLNEMKNECNEVTRTKQIYTDVTEVNQSYLLEIERSEVSSV